MGHCGKPAEVQGEWPVLPHSGIMRWEVRHAKSCRQWGSVAVHDGDGAGVAHGPSREQGQWDRGSGGEHHGLPAVREYRTLWDVPVAVKPNGGGGNRSGFRCFDADAVFTNDLGSMDSWGHEDQNRQPAGADGQLHVHVQLGRHGLDHQRGADEDHGGVSDAERAALMIAARFVGTRVPILVTMSPLNSDRTVVRIIREVAAEHGVTVETFGEGWILRLSKGGTGGETVRFLYGYGFDLNSAATHAIACDKAATADVLAARDIPCVEHKLFLHPKMAAYVAHQGNWEGMLRFAREHPHGDGFDVVVKDNGGTGGRGVYRCRTEVQLEHAVYRLFDQAHAIALSPFYDAPVEHRFVMLGGRCEVAYTKLRPTVTGDGAPDGAGDSGGTHDDGGCGGAGGPADLEHGRSFGW